MIQRRVQVVNNVGTLMSVLLVSAMFLQLAALTFDRFSGIVLVIMMPRYLVHVDSGKCA